MAPRHDPSITRAAVVGVARRPGLWPTAVRQALRLAAPGWWRRRPFLPRPPQRYLAFRAHTQDGTGERPPTAADVVHYLQWCKDQRSA